MKAYLIKKTMIDGSVEGVVFTDRGDALTALNGEATCGSTLAVAWCETYGGDDGVQMVEIEI
jgi:hypothetical protein